MEDSLDFLALDFGGDLADAGISLLRAFFASSKAESSPKIFKIIQGVPHLRGFHYCGSHYRGFWLMYGQVEDFRVSRGPLLSH